MNKEELENKIKEKKHSISAIDNTISNYEKARKDQVQKLEGYRKQLEELNTLEVGRWYKLTSDYGQLEKGMVFMFKKYQSNGRSYAVVSHGIYLQFPTTGEGNDYIAPNVEFLTPAKDSEVEEALIKEAKRRGFKEGVKFLCVINNTEAVFANEFNNVVGEWEYRQLNNSLSKKFNQFFFSNGKWATIIKQPTAKLNVFVVGKWYKCEKGIACFQRLVSGDYYGYGFNKGTWLNDGHLMMSFPDRWELATDKEVKEALIKEANRRGYEKNCKVMEINIGGEQVIDEDGFHMTDYCIHTGEKTGWCLFGKGKWAEIIKEPTVNLSGEFNEAQLLEKIEELKNK